MLAALLGIGAEEAGAAPTQPSAAATTLTLALAIALTLTSSTTLAQNSAAPPLASAARALGHSPPTCTPRCGLAASRLGLGLVLGLGVRV